VTSDSDQPDPRHSVPRVSFGSAEPADAAEPAEPAREEVQSDADRALQEENAATSLDQPSQ
jgi:hypothetical protein